MNIICMNHDKGFSYLPLEFTNIFMEENETFLELSVKTTYFKTKRQIKIFHHFELPEKMLSLKFDFKHLHAKYRWLDIYFIIAGLFFCWSL